MVFNAANTFDKCISEDNMEATYEFGADHLSMHSNSFQQLRNNVEIVVLSSEWPSLRNADDVSLINIAKEVGRSITRAVTFVATGSNSHADAIEELELAGVQTITTLKWTCMFTSSAQDVTSPRA